MKITAKWLKKHNACAESADWVLKRPVMTGAELVKALVTDGKIDWASWLIVRLLKRKKRVQYAIFAAEQVIEIFEREYPEDERPREAIAAAKEYLKNSGKKNRKIAVAAADAAREAVDEAVDDAYAAYTCIAYATYAACAAHAAAYVAAEAAADAHAAYLYATYAVDEGTEMKTRIINYGISLTKK